MYSHLDFYKLHIQYVVTTFTTYIGKNLISFKFGIFYSNQKVFIRIQTSYLHKYFASTIVG